MASRHQTDGVRRHLLVTNDYPPKIGGIQSYLWDLWRRLPGDDVRVLTTPHDGDAAFDAASPHRIDRAPEPWLGPWPWLVGRIDAAARDHGAELVVVDPAVPLGAIAPRLSLPYAVVLHGAEVTVPGRVPGIDRVLRRVLRGAHLWISAGGYPLAEAERCAGLRRPSVLVPPGVDHARFHPLGSSERTAERLARGFGRDDIVIASVNRLVPRKGMHVVIEAMHRLQRRHPDLRAVLAGSGRELDRLRRLADDGPGRIELPGRLDDDDVVRLYGAADLMVMPCSSRWGGLEQEGFGISFLEAAACGLPQIAGRSGGAHEAVDHDVSGLIVDDPTDAGAVARAIEQMVVDPARRARMGAAARRRVLDEFDQDDLAARLAEAIDEVDLAGAPVSDGAR